MFSVKFSNSVAALQMNAMLGALSVAFEGFVELNARRDKGITAFIAIVEPYGKVTKSMFSKWIDIDNGSAAPMKIANS